MTEQRFVRKGAYKKVMNAVHETADAIAADVESTAKKTVDDVVEAAKDPYKAATKGWKRRVRKFAAFDAITWIASHGFSKIMPTAFLVTYIVALIHGLSSDVNANHETVWILPFVMYIMSTIISMTSPMIWTRLANFFKNLELPTEIAKITEVESYEKYNIFSVLFGSGTIAIIFIDAVCELGLLAALIYWNFSAWWMSPSGIFWPWGVAGRSDHLSRCLIALYPITWAWMLVSVINFIGVIVHILKFFLIVAGIAARTRGMAPLNGEIIAGILPELWTIRYGIAIANRKKYKKDNENMKLWKARANLKANKKHKKPMKSSKMK